MVAPTKEDPLFHASSIRDGTKVTIVKVVRLSGLDLHLVLFGVILAYIVKCVAGPNLSRDFRRFRRVIFHPSDTPNVQDLP